MGSDVVRKSKAGDQRIARTSDNIAAMYRSTAFSLIFTELTGVIAVLIDGIVTSRFLGADAYSGISLLGPFSSMVLLVAGIFSTGCSIVCSQFVGQGRKGEANEAFNLSSLLTLLISVVVILACIAIPSLILQLCGVPLNKYPELNSHMYGYLDGYRLGIPAMMLAQVIAPILVMDDGKKLFSISSIVLCVVDVACDLLNVFVFHGGTFGMGRALVTMVGIYYSSNDLHGLRFLYAYALRLGAALSAVTMVAVLLAAPMLSGIYTANPEVAELAMFSIRWTAVAIEFYTSVSLLLHYLQGVGKTRIANTISIFERFIFPVAAAYVLGTLFGSEGILASATISEILVLVLVGVVNCIRCRGIPQELVDVMSLPKDFGGAEADNLYATLRTTDDVIAECERTYRFCVDHDVNEHSAKLMSLFVEEMATNIIKTAARKKAPTRVDFRLYMDGTRMCFSMMDLGDYFDPTLFYELHADDSPTKNLGIRMVMNMAEEVRYYSAFGSNNLVVYVN